MYIQVFIRGKTGVETRLRENAPRLLDIDGDSCHHIHNAAKKISETFDKMPESVFRSIHSDFQWSCDLRDYLQELCALLNVTYGMPDNYVPTRCLSVFNMAKDFLRMLDVYTLFYINFVGDQKLCQFLVVDITKKKRKLVKRVAIESDRQGSRKLSMRCFIKGSISLPGFASI